MLICCNSICCKKKLEISLLMFCLFFRGKKGCTNELHSGESFLTCFPSLVQLDVFSTVQDRKYKFFKNIFKNPG